MTALFDRIRAAFAKPAPLAPRVSGCDYEEDRYRVNVLRSMGRRVQIGPHRLTIVAEDFPSIKDCETAASRLQEILKAEPRAFQGMTVVETLDAIADRLRKELKIDPDPDHPRPFGCWFVAEPI